LSKTELGVDAWEPGAKREKSDMRKCGGEEGKILKLSKSIPLASWIISFIFASMLHIRFFSFCPRLLILWWWYWLIWG
jgi:hypothetical protein